MLTAAADVQMHGIYVEVVAWAPNRESWVIFADVSRRRHHRPE
jgi:phage terminase large subunit GpA-like protein